MRWHYSIHVNTHESHWNDCDGVNEATHINGNDRGAISSCYILTGGRKAKRDSSDAQIAIDIEKQ